MPKLAYPPENVTPGVVSPDNGHPDTFRKALIRRNKLRHAWRVLMAEGLEVPHSLWVSLHRAAQEVERLRGREGEAA